MSKHYIWSDLHLGHDNIIKYRPDFAPQFLDPEVHHEHVYERLASTINKRDKITLLGDICFNRYWLNRLKEINCASKVLILGNHDTESDITVLEYYNVFDQVHGLLKCKGFWFSHAPIHESELRGSVNIHGHTHARVIDSPNYFNACVDVNPYPINLTDIKRG